MSQTTSRLDGTPAAQSDNLVYEAVDARDLALFPDSYKGRRISLSGKVFGSEVHPEGLLIHMHVPLTQGLKGEAQSVAVLVSDALPSVSSGQMISVKGVCDGIHVLVRVDCCGVTVLPLIRAETLQ